MAKRKTKAGRKSKWDTMNMEDKLILVEGWARDGLTDKQIMENLGISHDLFYRWKREKPEFNEALKRGKEYVDRQVENALLKKALGYEYEEVTLEPKAEKDPETGETVIKERVIKRVIKHVQPDTTAAIFWLKNRKTEWRDVKNIEMTGKDGGPIEIESPREKLQQRIQQLAGRVATEQEKDDQ